MQLMIGCVAAQSVQEVGLPRCAALGDERRDEPSTDLSSLADPWCEVKALPSRAMP
ncbi:hypothetical protein [Streptomyces tsukubensis]|uniref:hypothetical protein n=1 Tax=Streptomyces tsukubensis TaxID=83656 RepID=UPI003450197B